MRLSAKKSGSKSPIMFLKIILSESVKSVCSTFKNDFAKKGDKKKCEKSMHICINYTPCYTPYNAPFYAPLFTPLFPPKKSKRRCNEATSLLI